jgi:hypothetical protein
MVRTAGSSNISNLVNIDQISTTSSKEIKHLAESSEGTAIERFRCLMKHQDNYLRWLETRHKELNEAKEEIARLKGEKHRGPKNATYRKYKWYAEHSVLLEAINGFEVFYKSSLVNLAKAIRLYVPAENIGGAIDAKVLWGLSRASIPELVFEHHLYHDLDNIDKVCHALVNARRYNKKSPKPDERGLVNALQAVFQIRHTLSHNHGVVTVNDRPKLKILGYEANVKEVIDPSKNNLRKSVMKLLRQEAEDFTDWLLGATAAYLQTQEANRGVELDAKVKRRINKLIGSHADLDALNWV